MVPAVGLQLTSTPSMPVSEAWMGPALRSALSLLDPWRHRAPEVRDLSAEAVGIAIAAPPSDGEANAELCRYLSKVLEVKKSQVVLEKGGRSREKIVKILAPLTAEEVLQKLRKEVAG